MIQFSIMSYVYAVGKPKWRLDHMNNIIPCLLLALVLLPTAHAQPTGFTLTGALENMTGGTMATANYTIIYSAPAQSTLTLNLTTGTEFASVAEQRGGKEECGTALDLACCFACGCHHFNLILQPGTVNISRVDCSNCGATVDDDGAANDQG